jgi:TorA maturation chaperone TorD
MSERTAELAYLLARRELWLLVSVGFVDPYHHARFELLKDQAFRRRVLDAAALIAQECPICELGPGEVNPKQLSLGHLFASLDTEFVTVESAYRQLFGLTAISQQCPACEVEFETNTDTAYRSQRLGDVAAFYQAFELQVSKDAGERIDHITVEAEFLYVLLAKEAAALYTEDAEGAEICRDARQKFFQEHVGWWVPAFGRLVSRVSSSDYYCRLAALTAGLSALEQVALELPPFTIRVIPRSSQAAAEATCFECANQADLAS